MGARQKLNSAYVWFCVLIAGLGGLMFQSWAAFTIGFVLSLAECVSGGAIRPAAGRARR